MPSGPVVRRISRQKLFDIFKSDELVRAYEDVLANVGQFLPDAVDAATTTANSAQATAGTALTTANAAQTTANAVQSRTINGHPLTSNVTVTASDVGAPSGSGTSTGTNTGDQFTSQAASTLLGRGSAAGAGPAQAITIGSGLTMTGTTLSAAGGAGSGDVVGPSSAVSGNVAVFSGTTGKIVADAGVAISGTNTGDQFTSVAAASVIGRASGAGAGAAGALTLSQVLDMVGSAANGDILIRSGGAWTRLGVGSTDQFLAVAAGLPAWTNAGWSYLGGTILGAAAATMSATIAAKKRLLVLLGVSGYSGSGRVSVRFNSITTASYNWRHMHALAGGVTWVNTESGTGTGSGGGFGDMIVLAPVAVTTGRVIELDIENSTAIASKGVTIKTHSITGSQAVRPTLSFGGGEWIAASAATQITSISFLADTGVNLNAGSGFIVLGRDY